MYIYKQAFGGALLGSAVIYVCPALMWVYKCRADIAKGNAPTRLQRVTTCTYCTLLTCNL
jgi:hypothetical protein